MEQEMLSSFEADLSETTRKKYILAMAVGLGMNEFSARENINGLFLMAAQLNEIDCDKSLNELGKEAVSKIRNIGSWFLPAGNYNQEFAVGIRVLKLMRETADSLSFANLRDMVACWSVDGGKERFDKALEKGF